MRTVSIGHTSWLINPIVIDLNILYSFEVFPDLFRNRSSTANPQQVKTAIEQRRIITTQIPK